MIGFGFVDLDDWIVKNAGKSIANIFDEDGEEQFREFERQAIREIHSIRNHVISAGGGAVMDDDNWSKMQTLGRVVWLNTPPAEIARRLVMKPDEVNARPLLRAAVNAPSKDERFKCLHDTIENIVSTRANRYGEADIEIVESYSTPQAAATLIKAELELN
jgi:shikimate kinase